MQDSKTENASEVMVSSPRINGADEENNVSTSYEEKQLTAPLTHSMRLNFDILFIVMNHFWSTQDVQSLMMTCSTLYNYGIPRLFNARLRVTKRNIVSFCAFMMRDLSRCKYITRMQFLFWRLPEPLGTQMTTILQHATELEEVIVDATCLDIDPRIPAAVAALPSLEDVQINGFCTDVGRIFKGARGPIKRVDAEPLGNDGGPADIIEVFSEVKATLERMIVGIASWEEHRDIVYPKLSWLVIWNPYECTVRGLITSFPNLRQLHVGIRPEEGVDNPLNWIDDFDAERHENIEDQTLRGSWTRLDTLRGDVDILYAMGLICRVNNLHLRVNGPKFEGEAFARFRGVVELSQPEHLHLSVTNLNIEHIRAVMLQAAVSGVKKFHISVTVPEGENYFKPSDFTDLLLGFIGHTGVIQMLEIELYWTDHRPGQTYSPWDTDDDDEDDLYIDSEDEGAVKASSGADTSAGAGEQHGDDEDITMDVETTNGPPTETPHAPGTCTESVTSVFVEKHPDHIYMVHVPIEVLAQEYFNLCPALKYLRLNFSASARVGSSENSGQWQRSEDGDEPFKDLDKSWIRVTGMSPI